ncbi:NAD(P)/FAD-dependent oxidoreductase [uncultured Jatrophihabitans sp.]|uniref:NAD(P)/FAD-dependent oxidoreductase n=1 Tax=uncultured Jatrophihabitans sp. TaxID=1610747 RepID=UPI0035CCA194
MTVADKADVVVVGGGIEGLATAWALTSRSAGSVLVLERGSLASAGTGKSSGIVRCHYGVPSLAAMALRGTEVLEQAGDLLDAEVGFAQVGYVAAVGPENVEPFRASVAAQQRLGVDTRLVSAEDVRGLWPGVQLDDFAAFAHEPRGGYGDAYSTAMAYAGQARRDGARIRPGTPVAEVVVTGGRVQGVRTADGAFIGCSTAVVAAGPWTPALVREHGVDVPVTVHREPILLVDPGRPLGAVPVLSDLVRLQYVRPEISGELLLGNSDLAELHPADPDSYRNAADDVHIEAAIAKFIHRFPELDATLTSSYAGCYDVTPDFNPIISATPVDGLFVATGFSGHGFKISAAVGELMADLVLYGESRAPAVLESDFRLSRFAEGRLTVTAHPYAGAGQLR